MNPLMVYLEKPPINNHSEKIAEGLLNLCGLTLIWDHPDGRRIFTVNVMPDDVPVAEIKWCVHESIVKPKGGISMDYSKIQEPCFVCECEDSLGEERGTQSHPINCGWRLRRANEGFTKGLDSIVKLCDTQKRVVRDDVINKIRNIAMASLMARYDIKKEE